MENTDKCGCVQDQHKYCICSCGSKVEFARKLGYNEKLLQEALIRLGPNSTPNELLSELIQLRDQYKILSDSEFDLIDTESNRSFTIFLPVSCRNKESNGLRAIVIDGSNVAISHGNKEIFSCRGIKICVDWFKNRGHKYITVFVPKWRKESFSTDNPIKDQEILQELERERLLVFTPSRFIGGKRMICYDDRYILKLAAETNGIVVSNDNYRDLVQESFEFKKVVEERLLMFSFVNDIFMPPDDPLGRSGPKLDNFLCMQNPVAESTSLCPYGKKCTYGSKCKFYHPKRCPGTNKTVTDRISVLAEHQPISKNVVRASVPVGKSHSMPLSLSEDCRTKEIVYRTKSSSSEGFSNSSVQTQSIKQSQLVHAVTSFSSCSLQEKEDTKELRLNEEPFLSNPETYSQINRIKSLTELSVTKTDEQANHHKKLQRKLYLNPPQHDTINPLHKHLMGSFTDSCTSNLYSSRHYEDATHISSSSISSLDNLNETCFQWSDQPICSLSNNTISNSLHLIDTRRKLFYHLASIFPAEYVTQAMDQYPTETEPHKICAGILKMFPKT